MTADFYGSSILVTGATGPLGLALSRRILQYGYYLRVMARDPQKLTHLAQEGAHVVEGDLTQPDSLREAVRGCHFVFHLAGAPDTAPRASFAAVNVHGTRALAEAALQAGVERFIHVSCTQVYGFRGTGTLDESSPLQHNADAFIDSKVQAELVLREMAASSGLPLIIPQLAQVYGPQMEAWTVRPLRKIASGDILLPHRGEGLLQPLYLTDAVDGILTAALNGKVGQAYILAGPQTLSTADFFGHYGHMLGVPAIPVTGGCGNEPDDSFGSWVSRLAGRQPRKARMDQQSLCLHHTFNGAKAYYDLQFAPYVQIEEGMQCIRQWLHKEFAAQKQGRTASGARPAGYSSHNPQAG